MGVMKLVRRTSTGLLFAAVVFLAVGCYQHLSSERNVRIGTTASNLHLWVGYIKNCQLINVPIEECASIEEAVVALLKKYNLLEIRDPMYYLNDSWGRKQQWSVTRKEHEPVIRIISSGQNG